MMRFHTSFRQSVIVFMLVMLFALTASANGGLPDLQQPPTPLGGNIDPTGGIENEPPPDPSNLKVPISLSINRRTNRVLRVIWHDRTESETGYDVERRTPGDEWVDAINTDWEVIQTFGPRTDWTEYKDDSVSPDTLYCYRIVAFNDVLRLPSSERCAYTRDGQNFPVSRIQLQIVTADVSNAGTDDAVSVRLNGNWPRVIPCCTNITWMNYSHDDRERSDTFTYDLNVQGIRRQSDITEINIEKVGLATVFGLTL